MPKPHIKHTIFLRVPCQVKQIFAIKAGDLLDLVILSRRLLAAVFNDQKLHTELIFQTSGLY